MFNNIDKVTYTGLRSEGDILAKLAPMLKARAMNFNADGRISVVGSNVCDVDTPWVHVRPSLNRSCGRWHNIYFDIFGFIPTACMECWKVVVRPHTLKQLFELYFLQEQLGYPSKCGLEKREYVCGNYGGYFYTDSLMEGLERWKEVSRRVHCEIDPSIKVILKRGCTEFEKRFPQSSNWQPFHGQKALERKLDNLFVDDAPHVAQPDLIKQATMAKWVRHAHSVGDLTYLQFTDQFPIFSVQYETYHPPGEEVGQFQLSDLLKKEAK